MKRNISLLMCMTLAAALGVLAQTNTASNTAPAASAPAAAAPVGKIGIIDIQGAIVNSNEGQRDLQALQKKLEPKQTELQKLNAEIEDLKKQLQTQGEKLNDEARANLQRSIDQKTKSLQREYEDYQQDAQGQQNEIAQRIGGKMMGVLDKYAKENGFVIILNVSDPQSPVLWANNATNVTQTVVELYNTQSGVPAPATPTARPATRPPGAAPAAKPAPSAPSAIKPKPPGR